MKKKASQKRSFFVRLKLALRELGSATGGFETVFLSFLHTRVTGQEAGGLEGLLVSGLVSQDESAGKTVTDSAGLAGKATAANRSNDIKLANRIGYTEGLVDDELKGFKTEIVINVLAVYRDQTGTGIKADTGDGLLSSAGAVKVRLCTGIHLLIFLSQSQSTTMGC